MSEACQREWRFYLDDMTEFAGKVLAYTGGLDQAGFTASGLVYDATLRNLELIGRAATRNRLIHGYLGIDDDTLWSIIRDDVPELLPLLQGLRNEVGS